FLLDMATKLRSGDWKDSPAAEAVADAFRDRAGQAKSQAQGDGAGLSAILLSGRAHKEGVHSIEGAGPILAALSNNPAASAMLVAQRKTATRIAGVASFVSVNPRVAGWRRFLAVVHESLAGAKGANDDTKEAVQLIMDDAEKEFAGLEEKSTTLLQYKIVNP